MSMPEWNFASYMACLGPTQLPHQNSHSENQNDNVEEQKVFAELRPANRAKDSFQGATCNNQGDNVEIWESISRTTEFPKEPFTEQIKCVNSSSLPDARNRCKDNHAFASTARELQQQLFPFDMSMLRSFDTQALLRSDLNENIKPEEAQSFMMQSFKQYLNFTNIFDGQEEDFKFPACVEEEYKKMTEETRQEASQKPPRIETTSGIMPQKYSKENPKSCVLSCGGTDSKHTAKSSVDLQLPNKGTNKTQRPPVVDPKRYEAREVEADIAPNEAALACESVENNNIENIESILNLINPAKDIMGQTFHNIPSTQPIYNDSDTQQCENNDENRIRRPMNAFMLWARKYRSLVAKEFSEASNSEISVKLGEIWNELSSEQQKPYFQKAESLKADHKLNYPNYVYQPRQAKFKQPRRNKTANLNDGEEEAKNENVFQSMTSELTNQISFCQKQNLESMHNIGHVASTVVLTQDGTEVDLAKHVNKQPQVMVPKPMYPDGVHPQSQKDQVKENDDIMSSSHIRNDRKRAFRSALNHYTYHEQDDYGEAEVGLVRDAMLPSFDKHIDDCDLLCEVSTAFDVMDLDAYLAGVDSEFAKYIDKHSLCSDDQYPQNSRAVLRGKKKRTNKQSQRSSKKKPRTQIVREKIEQH